MLHLSEKSRKGTSRVAAWVAALFALVQVVAMSHHADHDDLGPDDLLVPTAISAPVVAETSHVASASVISDRSVEQVHSASIAPHPDLCIACLLSAAAQTTLTHSPAPLAAPTLRAWRARRFLRSFHIASWTGLTSSGRGPPAVALSATA